MNSLTRLSAVLLATLGFSQVAAAACKGEPPQEAVDKAKAYYEDNATVIEHASRSQTNSPGKKIVINDYSKTPTTMYILDSKTGACEDSAVVGFGSGAGGALKGGCINESKVSPSGFHITSEINKDSKYAYPTGLTMLPCEGQEATGPRGIMIHPGTPDGQRGNTWGCASLDASVATSFVAEKIKGGSLVYNYWGDEDSKLPGCQDVGKSKECKLPGNQPGNGGHGGSTQSGGSSTRGSGVNQ